MATKREVVDYVKTNFRKGYSEEKIRQALRIGGYSKGIIDLVISRASKEMHESMKAPGISAKSQIKEPQEPESQKKELSRQRTLEKDKTEKKRLKIPNELSQDSERILSALSYPLGIVSIVLLILVGDKSKFGKFHGFQALFWNITYAVVYAISALFIFPFTFGIWPSNWIATLFSWLLLLVFFILSIIFAVRAYYGKVFRIPFIRNLVPSSARM